jgi:predicted  nucleic acid-binding Zn-ribbon protein
MENSREEKIEGITNHSDKYKKRAGREAFQNEDETQFLDHDALEKDLTDLPDAREGDHGQIVDSEHHPENQEWNSREEQNRSQSP